jgi:heme/copper-type cytochrome/quinol oxidase subunit 3
MSTKSLAYPVRPEPVRRKPIVASGVRGMLVFIFTEVMFFAGLISAHTIGRAQNAGGMWPPYGQPRLPVEETAVNTAALLVSGIVLFLSWGADRRPPPSARNPLLRSRVVRGVFVEAKGLGVVGRVPEGVTQQSSY